MLTTAEENYLKAIYKINEKKSGNASTNAIAGLMNTAAASVTDMLKKLAEKGFIDYEKYRGVKLTQEGRVLSMELIRKHRLWETFLHDILKFEWDEVHEVAEQLEHIHSVKLTDRLDEFLGFPKFDPHGDPIPDSHGRFTLRKQQKLSSLEAGDIGKVVGVLVHAKAFLQQLVRLYIAIDTILEVVEKFGYDHSMKINIDGNEYTLSKELSDNLLIQRQ